MDKEEIGIGVAGVGISTQGSSFIRNIAPIMRLSLVLLAIVKDDHFVDTKDSKRTCDLASQSSFQNMRLSAETELNQPSSQIRREAPVGTLL